MKESRWRCCWRLTCAACCSIWIGWPVLATKYGGAWRAQAHCQRYQDQVGEVDIGLDIEPVKGAADSGDLEVDLPSLFVAVAEAAEAAEERGSAVAILIDEIKYFSAAELSALIMAMHKIQQRQLPIALVAAGLPILPGLAGESKSYAERLFSFPDIGALRQADAVRALNDPLVAAGEAFDPAALEEIFLITKG
jgi:hypothetical protein